MAEYQVFVFIKQNVLSKQQRVAVFLRQNVELHVVDRNRFRGAGGDAFDFLTPFRLLIGHPHGGTDVPFICGLDIRVPVIVQYQLIPFRITIIQPPFARGASLIISDPAFAGGGERFSECPDPVEHVGSFEQEDLIGYELRIAVVTKIIIGGQREAFELRHSVEPFAVQPRAKVAVGPYARIVIVRHWFVKNVLRKQQRLARVRPLFKHVELHAVDGNGVIRAGLDFTYLILPSRNRVGVGKAHPHRRADADRRLCGIAFIAVDKTVVGNGSHVIVVVAGRTEPPTYTVSVHVCRLPASAGSGELGAVIGIKRVVRNVFAVLLAPNIGFGKQEHLVARFDGVCLIVVLRRGVYIRGLGKGGKPSLAGEPFAVEPLLNIAALPCRGIGIERHSGNGLLRKQQRLSVVHREDIELHAVDRYGFSRSGNEVRRRRPKVVKLL